MIRLLLSDDHPVVRAGIRALLESEADLQVVAEAATAEDAVRLAAASDVDLVLMDLQFPGAMQGAEATRRIRSHATAPRVLAPRTTTPTPTSSARSRPARAGTC